MSSPPLSCSGTGSAPRSSTQHGTFPLGYTKSAYQSRNSRTVSWWPSRSSAAEVSAPSRIQDRAYARDPGWIAGPSWFTRM